MTRALIYFVLGAILLALGIWWWTIVCLLYTSDAADE